MARGINEIDVHTAADALVAAGERPTVDRIRAHLGTGSPNTVTRWLETWWKNLGTRLQPDRPELKDAPEVLAELAGQWWALALEHARETVLQELSDAQQALAAEYDELRAQQQTFAEEASELHAKAETSLQAERLAATQAIELQRLVDQLQAQLAESAQQRTLAAERLDQAEYTRQALDTRLHELQELARSERESLVEHAKSVEDRALSDVDRARQEAKELRAKLSAATRRHTATETSSRLALEQAQAAASAAIKDADSQRARSEVLEDQLSKLQNLPAALDAAFQRNQQAIKPTKQTKARSKRMPKR